jgi:hypothetical protein
VAVLTVTIPRTPPQIRKELCLGTLEQRGKAGAAAAGDSRAPTEFRRLSALVLHGCASYQPT